MKKRLLIVLLCFCMVLTACKKANEYIDSTEVSTNIPKVIDVTQYQINSFTDSLCVAYSGETYNNNDLIMNAKAGLLFNISKNEVVYSKNIFDKMYPASITKVLTAYCAIKYGKEYNIDFSKTITVNDCVNVLDDIPDASRTGLFEGDMITLEDAMYCMMLGSGNDAALIVAENIAGSVEEFIKLMNYEAQRIGASHSNFCNPHGLYEDDHYTSAYDLYLIFNEAIKQPEFIKYISTTRHTFTYKTASGVNRQLTTTQTNRYKNGKVAVPEGIKMIGGKTGYEDLAGNCLIILSQNKEDDYFISVVLFATSQVNLYDNMTIILRKEN